MGRLSFMVTGLKKAGVALIDILILTGGFIYLWLRTVPLDDIGFIAVSGLWLFVWMFIIYIAIIAVVSLFLSRMMEDSTFAKIMKTVVSTILTFALMDIVLPVVLLIMGYTLEENIRNVLLIISIVRWTVKIWLGRRLGLHKGAE